MKNEEGVILFISNEIEYLRSQFEEFIKKVPKHLYNHHFNLYSGTLSFPNGKRTFLPNWMIQQKDKESFKLSGFTIT